MSDFSYSALGGDCTIQDGGYTPTYGTSGGFTLNMVKTLSTWTHENQVKQEIEDYENGRVDHDE